MSFRLSSRSTALLIALACTPALAHEGSRVWIGNTAGVTTTFTSDDDFEPTVFSPANVFTTTLTPFFGVYTTEFPGYEVRTDGGGVPSDTLFGFDLTGPLLAYDAASGRLRATSDVYAGGSIPQLAVSLGSTVVTTDTGVKSGFDFFFHSGIGDHAHLSFTLLGDGMSPSAPSPDGVYALPMRLRSDRLAFSDWYYLVFAKNPAPNTLSISTLLAQQMANAREGDTNFDGSINFDDLLTLAQNYGSSSGRWWGSGDFNFDGDVDFDDLLQLAQGYGSTALITQSFQSDWALAQTIAPEPVSLIAALGFASLGLRKRW
jgi:hypothetical protein